MSNDKDGYLHRYLPAGSTEGSGRCPPAKRLKADEAFTPGWPEPSIIGPGRTDAGAPATGVMPESSPA